MSVENGSRSSAVLQDGLVSTKEWLLTPEDVADRMSAKKSTVYSWVHQRKIPYLKVGGLLRFRLLDVENWLDQQRVDVWA